MKLRVHQQSGPSFRHDGESIHFGDYDIPGDISEEVAQAVVAAGAGEFVEEESAKKTKKSEPDHLS